MTGQKGSCVQGCKWQEEKQEKATRVMQQGLARSVWAIGQGSCEWGMAVSSPPAESSVFFIPFLLVGYGGVKEEVRAGLQVQEERKRRQGMCCNRFG